MSKFKPYPHSIIPQGDNVPHLPILVMLLMLVIFSLTRIGLGIYTGATLVDWHLWLGILAKGLWFDLSVIAILIAMICLYEAVLPNEWRASRWHGLLRRSFLWFVIALLLFGAVSEVVFWIEFSTRFNFIAVDYLLYTHEVINNIRESYPVGWILAGIGVTAAGIMWLLHDRVHQIDTAPISRTSRLTLLAIALAAPVLSIMVSSVDQMEGSENAYADELSGNGLFTLVAAMRRNELDYDKFYRTMPQAEADAWLKELGVKRPPLDNPQPNSDMLAALHTTPLNATPFSQRPRNVVLISMESMSAAFLGAYGATSGWTPNMDQLAREGIKFEHVFATGTRTVRGLEALSLGTPPIPGQAIVRRPNNEHLATIGEILKLQNYSTFFFYGGYGYFDNMNAYYSGNNYQVIDRTDFPEASVMFENAWGVADEALFDNTFATLDKEFQHNRPFFAQIMTTSNHRPYTYPAGRIDFPSPGGRAGGVKYTDYAIGKFIKDAKTKPWFKETLFVIVADHCASVAGKSKLPIESYHIPLIFYAPALLKPGTYSPMVSQIDLAPTIIDVLGQKGADLYFGRSFYKPGKNLERVFISNYQELGYYRNDVLTILSPKKKAASFSVNPKTYATIPTTLDEQGLKETIAYYQTASRAFKKGALHAPSL